MLGMIHGGHIDSELWGLEQVRETIRSIDPEVVCPEIPPAHWPGTLATWQQDQVVTDSRVKRFPEYVEVLLPLIGEMDFVIEPSAGWTEAMAVARRARMKLFETSTEDSAAFAAYERDERWVQGWLADYPAPMPDDDPFSIHSPAYDLRTKIELGPYEYHLNEVIGPPGGWRYINEEHFALIAAAIAAHPGQRILVTFGAGHKYWFVEQLRQMPGVVLRDVRPYLPGAATRPATGQQAAVEELALAVLEATAGSRPGDWHDEPYLGPIEVVSEDDDGVHLRAEVRRLHDDVDQAQWLTATLQVDPERPDGFIWTALQLPTWLEEQGLSWPQK